MRHFYGCGVFQRTAIMQLSLAGSASSHWSGLPARTFMTAMKHLRLVGIITLAYGCHCYALGLISTNLCK